VVYADEEKLFRAFANIIGNCIRYANNTVSIVPKIIDRSKIEIVIRDDGPGIDSNELPNIFERFYKGKKGNVGLGLAISKNIIERHNGKITAPELSSFVFLYHSVLFITFFFNVAGICLVLTNAFEKLKFILAPACVKLLP